MMRSLTSAVAGLQNHQTKMDIIGHNIANINTIGFKGKRVTFADQISQMLRSPQRSRENLGAVNPMSVGIGMKIQSIDTNYSQGALETTGFVTDLAIQGKGFFAIRRGSETFYTRSGNFTIDPEGKLVDGSGGIVQGKLADSSGEIGAGSTLGDVILPLQLKVPARATDTVQFYSNLDASASNSTPSLVNSGASGATTVSGVAANGAGGTHSITITGQQATNSTNTSSATGLNLEETLESLGVTDTSGFTATVDLGSGNEMTYTITGVTATSTVSELISALNQQVTGADFEYVDGAIQVTREYAGDGSVYNVRLSDSDTSNVVQTIFGGSDFDVNNGTASTLAATDTFVGSIPGSSPITTQLEFIPDDRTGIMTDLTGIGGGGVDVVAINGFSATDGSPLVVSTADTSHTTSISVYDQQGGTHNLSMTFTRTATPNQWAWEASVAEPATAGSGNRGYVTFNDDGSLASFTYNNNATEFLFSPGPGQDEIGIQFNPGTLGAFDGITQTASSFSTAAIHQNGYGVGVLDNIMIDGNGTVLGNFTNGIEQNLAQIMLADFGNEQGLMEVSGNLWRPTAASGDPILGEAQTNFNSEIQSGYLEMSNVDLVEQFTEMITTQRGFQANARVITVSDQILTETTQLKR